jgi:hypothetical protein
MTQQTFEFNIPAEYLSDPKPTVFIEVTATMLPGYHIHIEFNKVDAAVALMIKDWVGVIRDARKCAHDYFTSKTADVC